MKIEWEEKDLKFIKQIKKGVYDNDINRLTFFTGSNPNKDETFMMEFKVTDAVLANHFLSEIFFPYHKLVEEFGIDIVSIGHKSKESFKDDLKQKIIDLIEKM